MAQIVTSWLGGAKSISVRSTSHFPSTNGNDTDPSVVTLAPPSGAQGGDVVMVVVTHRGQSSWSITNGLGQSWTDVGGAGTDSLGNTYGSTRIYTCIFNGSWTGGSNLVFTAGGTGGVMGIAFCLSGVKPDAIWNVSPSFAGDTDANFNVGSFTPSGSNILALVCASSIDDNIWSVDNGFTTLDPDNLSWRSIARSLSMVLTKKVVSGSTGTTTLTQYVEQPDAGWKWYAALNNQPQTRVATLYAPAVVGTVGVAFRSSSAVVNVPTVSTPASQAIYGAILGGAQTPTLRSVSHYPVSNGGTTDASVVTLTPPNDCKVGDVIVVALYHRGDATWSVTQAMGQTWVSAGGATTSSSGSIKLYTCVFNGNWTGTTLQFTAAGTAGVMGIALAFLGVDTSSIWNLTPVFTAQLAGKDFLIGAFTPTGANIFCIVASCSLDDNTWSVDNGFSALDGVSVWWNTPSPQTIGASMAHGWKIITGSSGTTKLSQLTEPIAAGWKWRAALNGSAPTSVAVLYVPALKYEVALPAIAVGSVPRQPAIARTISVTATITSGAKLTSYGWTVSSLISANALLSAFPYPLTATIQANAVIDVAGDPTISGGLGQLGVVSGLRPFSELQKNTGATRNAVLEFGPGVKLPATNWSLNSHTYSKPFSYVYGDIIRDIIGIECKEAPYELERVERPEDVEATEGTYCYDVDGLLSSTGVPMLYVHLYGAATPATSVLIANLGFYFSSGPFLPGKRTITLIGETLPDLSKNLLTLSTLDGELDQWTDVNNLTRWTKETIGPGGTGLLLTRVASLKSTRASDYASKLSGVFNPSGGYAIRSANITVTMGAYYRVSGYYTSQNAKARVRIFVGSRSMRTNGRDSIVGQYWLDLEPTYGETRRFFIDFRVPKTATTAQAITLTLSFAAYNESAGSVTGEVTFDAVEFRRIWRFNYYMPRLDPSSVPETEVRTSTIFFRDKSYQLGQCSLLNNDGFFDKLLGELLIENRTAKLLIGGVWPGGQRIPKEDYRRAYHGYLKRPVWSENHFMMDMEDARSFAAIRVPEHSYDATAFPNMLQEDRTRLRALLFGTVNQARLVCVDTTAGKYGAWELADPTGMYGIIGPKLSGTGGGIASYATAESASRNGDADELMQINGGEWSFDYDQATGRVTIQNSPKIILVETSSAIFQCDTGGAVITITISPLGAHLIGQYGSPAWGLLKILGDAMTTAGVTGVVCSFSEVTKKVTIGRSSGTFNIRCATGTKKDRGVYRLLGFDADADYTGASSYTAENVLDVNVNEIFLRVREAYGYKDDSLGTFTGTPNALITKFPEVAHFLLRQVAHIQPSKINEESFAASRQSDASAVVCAQFTDEISLAELFSQIEEQTLANIIVDGEGIWHYIPYSPTIAVSEKFEDVDFLSFDAIPRDAQDAFSGVRINYNWGDIRETLEKRPAELAGITQGNEGLRIIETFMMPQSSAEKLANAICRLIATYPVGITFSSRVKCSSLEVGDIIEVTSNRAPTITGRFSSTRFRIRGLKNNAVTGVTQVEAIEDEDWLTEPAIIGTIIGDAVFQFAQEKPTVDEWWVEFVDLTPGATAWSWSFPYRDASNPDAGATNVNQTRQTWDPKKVPPFVEVTLVVTTDAGVRTLTKRVYFPGVQRV